MDYGIDRPAELAVEATARPAAKNYTLGDGLFALFCLAAGYMGVRWYFFGSYGIGTTLLFFTLGVGISVYLRGKGCALGRAYWAGILLLLGFGTVFSLFRPSFATFCTAVFLLLLLTLWAYRTAMDDGKGLIRRHWPADAVCLFRGGGRLLRRAVPPGARRETDEAGGAGASHRDTGDGGDGRAAVSGGCGLRGAADHGMGHAVRRL